VIRRQVIIAKPSEKLKTVPATRRRDLGGTELRATFRGHYFPRCMLQLLAQQNSGRSDPPLRCGRAGARISLPGPDDRLSTGNRSRIRQTE